ncbi:cytosolic endo-beta-N-acetylglucosaminidase isoform X1 [Drosophila tropicalis]|uniref:cytosolic endo-beta-N-acetylglucosaminidase isoform X1 n=2 Tax=Drosophila tropicalis TaxID=46794 RepID=UPI0035ABCA43
METSPLNKKRKLESEQAKDKDKDAGTLHDEDPNVVEEPQDKKEGQANEQHDFARCSVDNCENSATCGCPQLEAEPLRNNQQLLDFQVRSRHIRWPEYVQPLDTEVRGQSVYLDKQSDFVSSLRRRLDADNRRELLVCHDMMGNYLNDRHFHSSEKYDDYRFLHWSAVDYFCYFSHQYVTIPPSGWLNAAHRHGVPVLGTYIVEDDQGSRLLHEVLANVESVQRIVAAMTRLCLHFGFEGWLVNVECRVRAESMANLYRFVEELREATENQVPHGRVIWYDSVIDNGDLSWQNELNDRNVRFFRLSHGTLINYNWNDRSLEHSAAIVSQEKTSPHRVFMGLDVFGRGQIGRFQSSQTLSRIAAKGFSGGIFAPAWCFETLQQFGYNIRQTQGDETVNAAFLDRNERWWARLWPWLATHPYRSLPFYTDFCVGSGRSNYERGRRRSHRSFFNLAQQSLQPSVPLVGNAEHCFDRVYQGGNSLRIINYARAFRLLLTDFDLPHGVLLLGYAFKQDKMASSNTFDLVLRFSPTSDQNEDLYVFCGLYDDIMLPGRCYISPLNQSLDDKFTIKQLSSNHSPLADDWQVRHYMVKFDGPVRLLDIGVKCSRSEQSTAGSYLGAIHVNSLSLEDCQSVHQKTEINVYTQKLWQK